MNKEIEGAVTIVKKHKVGISVGLLAAIVLLYIIKKGSSLASSGVASGGESAIDLQYQQLSAATDVQQAGIAAQTESSVLAAQVSNNQTAAALKAAEDSTTAGVIENSNAIAGSIALAQISADSTDYQAGLTAETQELAINKTADVYESEIAAKSAQASLEKEVLDKTLKTGRSSTGITQIISSLFGQGPAAIAANQPSQVASSPSSVIGAIGESVGGIFAGIFG